MLESNLSTLNCVYFALFFVGVGYALFIVITGGLSDIDMPDVDIDIPQIDLPGDVDIPGGGHPDRRGRCRGWGDRRARRIGVAPQPHHHRHLYHHLWRGWRAVPPALRGQSPHEPGLVSGRGAWLQPGSCTCSTASSSSAPRHPASCAGANSSDYQAR